MQTNSVDSSAVREPRSRSIVGAVASNVLFGAVAGAGLRYMFPANKDEFVKGTVENKAKEMHGYRVNTLKEKVSALTTEVEGITEEAIKASKTKELSRIQNKLAYLEKQGARNYAKGFAKYPSKLSGPLMARMGEFFDANKAKTLAEKFSPEEIAEMKNLSKNVKLSRVLKGAKTFALMFGAIGLLTGVAEKMMVKKVQARAAKAEATA